MGRTSSWSGCKIKHCFYLISGLFVGEQDVKLAWRWQLLSHRGFVCVMGRTSSWLGCRMMMVRA